MLLIQSFKFLGFKLFIMALSFVTLKVFREQVVSAANICLYYTFFVAWLRSAGILY